MFSVTHPFHPLRGQAFELLTYRFNWGEDRVMYVGPTGRTRSFPVAWTSIAPIDPFVNVAAGRALFRLEDLVALTALLRDVRPSAGESAQEDVADVK